MVTQQTKEGCFAISVWKGKGEEKILIVFTPDKNVERNIRFEKTKDGGIKITRVGWTVTLDAQTLKKAKGRAGARLPSQIQVVIPAETISVSEFNRDP